MTGFTYGQSSGASLGQSSGGLLSAYPRAPKNLAVSDTRNTEIDLTWDNDNSWDSLDILRAQSSGSVESDYTTVDTLNSIAESYTDTGLENGEKYYYRVKAIRSGISELSTETSGTTTVPTPSGLSVDNVASDEISISWNNNDNSSDGTIEIHRSQDGSLGPSVASFSDLTTTSYTDTGLEDGERLYYTVRRSTDHAHADSSQVDDVTPLPAPSNLSGSVGATVTQVDLSWDRNDDNTSGDHKIYRSQSGSKGSQIGTVSHSTTTYTDSGLTSGTDYWYTVERDTTHKTASVQEKVTTGGIAEDKTAIRWHSESDWEMLTSNSSIAFGNYDGYSVDVARRGFPTTINCIAIYTFESSDDTLTDRKNDYDGTVNGSANITYNQTGVNDTNAWSFTGSMDDYADIPRTNTYGEQSVTMIANIKPSDTTDPKNIVKIGGDDEGERFMLAVASNCDGVFAAEGDSHNHNFSTSSFTDSWVQVAARFDVDNGNCSAFLNGSKLGTEALQNTPVRINNNRNQVGSATTSRRSFSNSVDWPYDGLISEVLIADRAISDSTIGDIADSVTRATATTKPRQL